jgi:uncharacterized membrane protein YfcA
MTEYDLVTALLGAVVGAILALTGAGGGILAVPLLVFGLGLPLVKAAPVGLLAVGLAAAIGALLGLKQGIVRYRAAGFVAGIGLLMAPVGLYVAHRLPSTPLALVFAGVMVYASLRMFCKAVRELHHGKPPPRLEMFPCVLNPLEGRLRWTLPCARALALTGLLSGLLSGMLGVGGLLIGRQAAQRLAGPRLQQGFAMVGMLAAIMLAGHALTGGAS